jgi:hypothetical protein
VTQQARKEFDREVRMSGRPHESASRALFEIGEMSLTGKSDVRGDHLDRTRDRRARKRGDAIDVASTSAARA